MDDTAAIAWARAQSGLTDTELSTAELRELAGTRYFNTARALVVAVVEGEGAGRVVCAPYPDLFADGDAAAWTAYDSAELEIANARLAVDTGARQLVIDDPLAEFARGQTLYARYTAIDAAGMVADVYRWRLAAQAETLVDMTSDNQSVKRSQLGDLYRTQIAEWDARATAPVDSGATNGRAVRMWRSDGAEVWNDAD